MDTAKTKTFVKNIWNESIVPELIKYIGLPNLSPFFDPKWQENGHMDRAVSLVVEWCRSQKVKGMKLEVVRLPGRTPLLFIEIPGNSERCALLYGHLDKQPEMEGWSDGLGPWKGMVREDKLYGRGGGDDGYAVFASLASIMALQEQSLSIPRCVIIIETCEESGSYDLPYYIESLAPRIGTPDLIVCLDSGCGNYDQLWCTTSLRGLVAGNLVVELLKEGVHSGDASGIVPSSFRVLRQLLSRLEDEDSGEILPQDFHVRIPSERIEQARTLAQILGTDLYAKFPFHEGVQPVTGDLEKLILNRTWRPMLSITGAAGLPSLERAGNVSRPMTAVKISLRVPPTCDADAAGMRLKELLEKDPPYGAHVRFELQQCATGWDAPESEPWLRDTLENSSQCYFGKGAAYMGEGGSIPFMAMLGAKYPKAQFVITGVLGPNSNAHGPNEFLHIPTAKKLTCCVAQLLADFVR